MKILLVCVLITFGLSLSADELSNDALARTMTKSIAATVARSGVPGATVVAVDRKGVIYAADFGMRDVEAGLPVTGATRFYIASSTKTFTALAAMLMAADGALDVDAPLETVLPDLHLNRSVSLRDLLAHRSGFENDAVTFRTAYSGEFDTHSLFSLIEKKSATIPRSFRYGNLNYIIAAYAMQRAAGEAWNDIVAKRVLSPVGMTETTTHLPSAGIAVATPYLFDGEWKRAAPKSERTLHAAGGMFSTSRDLARFVIMSMNHGGGVLPRRVIDETQSPQIHLKRRFGRFDRFAYGLGWYLADYEGELLVHHFGGFRGAQAHMSFMPERGIGVVVLTNADVPLAHSIAAFVYDSLLRKADARKHLDEDVQRLVSGEQKFAASLEASIEKAVGAISSGDEHPFEWSDGTYDGDFGTFIVNNGHVTLGEMNSTLVHRKGSLFVVRFAADEPTFAIFHGDMAHADSVTWDGHEFRKR